MQPRSAQRRSGRRLALAIAALLVLIGATAALVATARPASADPPYPVAAATVTVNASTTTAVVAAPSSGFYHRVLSMSYNTSTTVTAGEAVHFQTGAGFIWRTRFLQTTGHSFTWSGNPFNTASAIECVNNASTSISCNVVYEVIPDTEVSDVVTVTSMPTVDVSVPDVELGPVSLDEAAESNGPLYLTMAVVALGAGYSIGNRFFWGH